MPDGSISSWVSPSWVVPLRTTGTRPPLFCACAGDGDVMAYRELTLALPDDQPVYGFGIPPLPAGASFPSVELLASDYVQAVRAIQPEGPYNLCGHSFGGLVAYEMAALLRSTGADVEIVAMVDTLYPGYKRQMSRGRRLMFHLTYLISRVVKYARNMGRGRLDRVLSDAVRALYGHTKRLYWRVVRLMFARLNRAPPAAITSDALSLAAAWHAYTTTHRELPAVMFNAVDRPLEFRGDPSLGWSACIGRPLSIHMIPGDHYTMLRPPHVQTLAGSLAPYLSSPARTAQVSVKTTWR